MPPDPGLPGPLELLVLQPTPFCNINCSYCYLPDRQSTRRMSPETLDQTFRWVFASGLAREPFALLWHAGEPLVLPVSFYATADDLLRRHNVANVPVLQSFQTNAMLLDADWCAFLRRPDIHLGVSVDGPDFLHDRHRRTRQGRGTLDRVLRGIQLLHEHGIPFQVITVLTADSLDYPDELKRLRDDPSLAASAVDEVLRFESPVQFDPRRANRDTEVAGVRIAENTLVLNWLGSANRDEAVFDRPDVFDIGREKNAHLAFGYGTHHCLGHNLARLEATVALDVLLARTSGFARTDRALLPLHPSPVFKSVTKLPVRLDPR